MKKLLLASITLLSILLSANSSALQLNIAYGDDITNHQDKIDFQFDVYYKNGPGQFDIGDQHLNVRGVPVANMPELTSMINRSFADTQPITTGLDGKHSKLTLGIRMQDGVTIFAASCSHIPLGNVINVFMTEEGCTVTTS